MDQLDKILAVNVITNIMMGNIETYQVKYTCNINKSVSPQYEDFNSFEIELLNGCNDKIAMLEYDKKENTFLFIIPHGEIIDVNSLVASVIDDTDKEIEDNFLQYVMDYMIRNLKNRKTFSLNGWGC